MSTERGRRYANVATDEKSTRSTLDHEGWLHTGDVAEIDSCGRFKIIERIKVRFLASWTK
jgi:long-chain acyl-CoA synthetase